MMSNSALWREVAPRKALIGVGWKGMLSVRGCTKPQQAPPSWMQAAPLCVLESPFAFLSVSLFIRQKGGGLLISSPLTYPLT